MVSFVKMKMDILINVKTCDRLNNLLILLNKRKTLGSQERGFSVQGLFKLLFLWGMLYVMV